MLVNDLNTMICRQICIQYQLKQKRMPQKYEKALKYLNAAKFQKAIKLFEEIFQNQSPSDKVVYSYQSFLNMCIAYIEAGQFQKAKQVCNNLIKASPDADEVYGVLAITLTYLGQCNEAIKICNKGLEQCNKNWKLYYSKGFVYSKMNKFEQASENYGLAITKNSLNNPKCYIFQSHCMANLGLLENARKNMNYAITAMGEDQKKNCRDLFKYEIQNIRSRIKIFERYDKKFQKVNQSKEMSLQQRQNLQKQLIKIIGKSLQYNATIDNSKKKQKKRQLQVQNGKQKQVTSQVNSADERMSQISQSICVQLQKFDKTIQTRKSFNSEQPDSNSQQNKIICEWLRGKCCIY